MQEQQNEVTSTSSTSKEVEFARLLNEALTKPGIMTSCYSNFRRYSFCNSMWIAIQSMDRNLPIGPAATFKRWNELGRSVIKGQKAMMMLMPVMVTKEKGTENEHKVPVFIPKNLWFTLAQTTGPDYTENCVPPEFDLQKALSSFGIKQVDYTDYEGNSGGYAFVSKKLLAVNPLNKDPFKVFVHEMAHIVLEHNDEEYKAHRPLCEVEAESVAYLVCSSLGKPEDSVKDSRAYIQNWLKDNVLDEKRAKRIINTAGKILSAGQSKSSEVSEET